VFALLRLRAPATLTRALRCSQKGRPRLFKHGRHPPSRVHPDPALSL